MREYCNNVTQGKCERMLYLNLNFTSTALWIRQHLLVEDTTGPRALASAPRERKIPRTVPFWSELPYEEMRVVRQGTTVADAMETKQGVTTNSDNY